MIKFQHLPLKNIEVTSNYGMRNMTLNGNYYWWHNGVDFKTNIGTPIYAVSSGTVKEAKNNIGGYGLYVAIDHGKFGTLYAHLSKIEVTSGKNVNAGDIIGYSGNTGASTGPHLHFELRSCEYKNFWDRAYCDKTVFMQTVDPMLYIEDYNETKTIKNSNLSDEITIEEAKKIVQEAVGLENKTMDYLVNDYKYGNELVIKIARALNK